MADEITTGELDRRLGRMEEHIERGFQGVRSDLAVLTASIAENYARKDVMDERLTALASRIHSLETARTWILRLGGSAVFLAILSAAGIGTGVIGG